MRLDHRTISCCRFLLLVAALLGAAGCGGVPKGPDVPLVPVSGKVTVNGKEMTAGVVSFHPDKGRNPSILVPSGIIKDGMYKLQTSGKDGAPPGAYMITVTAKSPTGMTPADAPTPPPEYENPRLALLPKEVKENASPGEYDIKIEASK